MISTGNVAIVVHVMDDLEVRKDVVIPGWEMWMTTSTSSGPGGQHANKAETRVTVHWNLGDTTVLTDDQRARVANRLSSHVNDDGELSVTAGDTRSQHRNRKIARDQIVEMVRKALKKPKRRKKTRPPWWAKRKRVQNKRHRGRIKKLRKSPKVPDDY